MEVGRSCISLDDRYLFDAGLKISEEGSEYPEPFDVQKVSTVFLSHAHLDHCGALPLLNHKGLNATIYCNIMTKTTSALLLKDSFHIELLENQAPGYSRDNIRNVLGSMQMTAYDKKYDLGDIKFSYIYAGHIPGSASILCEYEGKRIMYSGDINSTDTELMKGAKYNMKVDVLLLETTYGDRDHPDRQAQVKDFLQTVRNTINRGGTAIIPAFAVGRSQEIALMLAKQKWNVPIYMDGMAKKISNFYLKKEGYIRNAAKFEAAMRNITYVKKRKDRRYIAKEPCIIITTSGMLDGGPVIDYISAIYHDPRSSILLTGYQADETNGRLLLDEGKVYLDGVRIKVRPEVKKYDFSAHSGQKQLIEMVESMRPKHLILEHGDPESEMIFAKRFKKMKIYTPRIGECVEI